MGYTVIEREIGDRTLRLETGKWAKQADASVFATYGETSVLAAVVRGAPREGIDFFPLQVDYRERVSAAGKFPGGFRKREGAPSSKEILTMRNIDRPLRPLFAEGLRDEVLIQCWVESADGENDSDLIAAIAAAAAVSISSIPFNGPVTSTRVGRIDGKFVINPTWSEMQYSDLELLLSGHRQGVNMIEVGALEIPEADVLQAIKFGHGHMQDVLDMVDELVEKAGKEKVAELHLPSDELIAELDSAMSEKLYQAMQTEGKLDRYEAVKQVLSDYLEANCPEPGEDDDISYTKYMAIMARRKSIKDAFGLIEKKVTRRMILEGKRADGRDADQLRPLDCELDVLARTHGSAVFTRGETQAMVVCTLGVGRDEQIVDGLTEEYRQKFYLHYNFPPFCVGEARRVTGPSRREIGHGALAERSLAGILPDPADFPYTIRLVSEILESNGSSSMASICGGCLALMAAGVPIKATTAGISIGMVEEGDQRILLTDILGAEDHFGDMDFKVAGSRNGITGIQLDLKGYGLDFDLIEEVFTLARDARIKIIETIEQAIPAPRDKTSPLAPSIMQTKIDPEKIGKLIGPGGKTIRALEADTGATIEIEEDGTIIVSAVGFEKTEAALAEIEALCEEVKVDKIYNGTVNTIKDFGAFVEVIPGQDGLLHVSEMSDVYVKDVNDFVKIGDKVRVKVIEIDQQGRLRLSRKAVLLEEGQTDRKEGDEPQENDGEERRERRERKPRRDDGNKKGGGYHRKDNDNRDDD